MAGSAPVQTSMDRLRESIPPLRQAHQGAVHGLHVVKSTGDQARSVVTKMLALVEEFDSVLGNLKAGSTEVAQASTAVDASRQIVESGDTDLASQFVPTLVELRDGLKEIAGDYLVAGQKAGIGIANLKDAAKRLGEGAEGVAENAEKLKTGVGTTADQLKAAINAKAAALGHIIGQ